MTLYQAPHAFEFYCDHKDEEKLDHQKVEFKNLTIENFIKDTILNPLQDIFRKTSN